MNINFNKDRPWSLSSELTSSVLIPAGAICRRKKQSSKPRTKTSAVGKKTMKNQKSEAKNLKKDMIEVELDVSEGRSHPSAGGGVVQILGGDGVELVADPIDPRPLLRRHHRRRPPR